MPLFDLKRAYTDHIKSLNPEERKTCPTTPPSAEIRSETCARKAERA